MVLLGNRGVKLPETGSNRSAVLVAVPFTSPPATRTFPFASNVALWEARGELIVLCETGVKFSAAGANRSAVFEVEFAPVLPPAIRTLPLASRVAVCLVRADVMELLGERAGKFAVTGSNRSAVFIAALPLVIPPAIRTLPVQST